MKKFNSIITNLILISILTAIGCTAAMAQRSESDTHTQQEIRPFDFSNAYYSQNGVQPYFINNRPTGMDERSIFSKPAETRLSNVRILETLPAYNFDGSILYFNMRGELFSSGFNEDESGRQAMETAKKYPMFVFPSTNDRAVRRQANLIEAREDYFTKNPLGLSLIVEVIYTFRAHTGNGDEAVDYLNNLGITNGFSRDGSPIIKTIDEINYLTRTGLVIQQIKGLDNKGEAPFAIANVVRTNKPGAITRDAFLTTVPGKSGQPLAAETVFGDNFICLKKFGSPCSAEIRVKR